MAIEKVKLNYKSAVSKISPIGKIIIPSSHMEELDRAVRQKVGRMKQNVWLVWRLWEDI